LQERQISLHLEYDTDDYGFVSSVADTLNSLEIFHVFLSPPGDSANLSSELETELRKCHLLVVLFTRLSLRSMMIKKETEIVARENKLVIPLFLGGNLHKIKKTIPLLASFQEYTLKKDVVSVVRQILNVAVIFQSGFGISDESLKAAIAKFKKYEKKATPMSRRIAFLERQVAFRELIQEIYEKLGYLVINEKNLEPKMRFFDMSVTKENQKVWVKCVYGIARRKVLSRIGSLLSKADKIEVVSIGIDPRTELLARKIGIFLIDIRLLINQLDFEFRERFSSRLRVLASGGMPECPEKEEVRKLVSAPEGQNLEFKSTLRYDHLRKTTSSVLEKAVLKTICAFMNSTGGLLVIGVSDKREIVGLSCDYEIFKNKNADGFENHLTNIIGSRLGNKSLKFMKVSFGSLEGKEICKIKVSPSDSPVFLKDGDTEEFYVRTGNSSRPFSMGEAIDYIKGHWK
jgi:hypothetical protein